MAVFQYMIIFLLILQDASAATMATKKKNRAWTVQELFKAIPSTLELTNVQKMTEDCYIADIPHSVEGTCVIVYRSKAGTKWVSAVDIPEIFYLSSVQKKRSCRFRLDLNSEERAALVLRLQTVWKAQCLKQRTGWCRMVKKNINILLSSREGLPLDYSGEDVSSKLQVARLTNDRETLVSVWPIKSGKASLGYIDIPYKAGEPNVIFPFRAKQPPAKLLSAPLRKILWLRNKNLLPLLENENVPSFVSRDNL